MANLGEINPDAFNRLKYPEAYLGGEQRSPHGYGNTDPKAPSQRGFTAKGGAGNMGTYKPNFTLPNKPNLSTIPKGQNLAVPVNTMPANVPGTDWVAQGTHKGPSGIRVPKSAKSAFKMPPQGPLGLPSPGFEEGMRSVQKGSLKGLAGTTLKAAGGALGALGAIDAGIDLLPSSLSGRDDALDIYMKDQVHKKLFPGTADPVADEIGAITQQGLDQYDAEVGSPESREAHQGILNKHQLGQSLPSDESLMSLAPNGLQNTPASTDTPGSYQTANNRDAFITQDKSPDFDNDKALGVSFGDGKGSVSGLNPEQAARIQNSLALGNQVSGFNMDNMIDSTRSDADGKIMEALRNGNIDADKASALMNRDFRASDRMDRLGCNADAYIKPDAAPTDIKSAMAYGQNLNNFTRNGELSKDQALVAQQDYLRSLGGFKGVANAQPSEKTKAEINKINAETEQIRSGSGKKKKIKPAYTPDQIYDYLPDASKEEALAAESIDSEYMDRLVGIFQNPEKTDEDKQSALQYFSDHSGLGTSSILKLMYRGKS